MSRPNRSAKPGLETREDRPFKPLVSMRHSPRSSVLVTTCASPRARFHGLDAHLESVEIPYQGGTPQVLQTGLSVASQDLVTCGSRVCWADEGTNSIQQVDPSAGPAMTAVKMPAWFGQAASVAFDGTSFYVGSDGDSNGDSRIARFPATSGQGFTVASPRGGGAFAVDDECLYWTTDDGIYSLAKSVPGIVAQ